MFVGPATDYSERNPVGRQSEPQAMFVGPATDYSERKATPQAAMPTVRPSSVSSV